MKHHSLWLHHQTKDLITVRLKFGNEWQKKNLNSNGRMPNSDTKTNTYYSKGLLANSGRNHLCGLYKSQCVVLKCFITYERHKMKTNITRHSECSMLICPASSVICTFKLSIQTYFFSLAFPLTEHWLIRYWKWAVSLFQTGSPLMMNATPWLGGNYIGETQFWFRYLAPSVLAPLRIHSPVHQQGWSISTL